MFNFARRSQTTRPAPLGADNLLIFGVGSLIVLVVLVLYFWYVAPPPRESLITRTGAEIETVRQEAVPTRRGATSHIQLVVEMRDGELWLYNDYQPSYREALGLLMRKPREVVVYAYADPSGSHPTRKGLKDVRALRELEFAGRRIVDHDVLVRGELDGAREGLLVGLVVCPLVALICLGGYALSCRQAA